MGSGFLCLGHDAYDVMLVVVRTMTVSWLGGISADDSCELSGTVYSRDMFRITIARMLGVRHPDNQLASFCVLTVWVPPNGGQGTPQ